MNLAWHLKMVGLLQLLLAFAHLFFPRRFAWREELARLSLLNRQMFLVHCFFIVLTLVLFGVLSLGFTGLLMERTPLAKVVLTGLCVFWLARLVVQFFVYDSKLWRGNRFNTMAHVLFSLLWGYYTVTYVWALWHQWQS